MIKDFNMRNGLPYFKILMIDDDRQSFLPLLHIFNSNKFRISFAYDGYSAIEQMRQSDFHLIILDWEMPFMDGETFLQKMDKILRKEDGHDVPYIIYTGNSTSDLKVPKTKVLQMCGCVNKTSSLASRVQLFTEILNF